MRCCTLSNLLICLKLSQVDSLSWQDLHSEVVTGRDTNKQHHKLQLWGKGRKRHPGLNQPVIVQ